MRSRLQEMCVVVEMYGKDYRGTEKRASFAMGKKLAIVTSAPQLTAEERSPSAGDTTQGGAVEGTMFENIWACCRNLRAPAAKTSGRRGSDGQK